MQQYFRSTEWSEVKSLSRVQPGSSVHGIFQARILEWAAISFSRRSSQPKDRTQVSRIADRHFTIWATREAQDMGSLCKMLWKEAYKPLKFGYSLEG